MAQNNTAHPMQLLLADPAFPLAQRCEMLRNILNDPSPKTQAIVKSIFEGLASQNGEALHAEKTKQLNELLKAMQEGPLDRKSTRLNSSHSRASRMPSSA